MLKKLLIVIVAAVAIFLGYAAMQPSEFGVERSIVVNAPASAIFPHVNNLHNWEAWSPWAKLDPNAQGGFEGPEQGVGAVMSWSGNSDVGVGKMTITESRPDEMVAFRLDFQKPFEATNTAEFAFAPEGERQTKVTWKMAGSHDGVFMKALGLVMNCEKMVGQHFDQGLANLKAIAEQPAPAN